MPAVRKAEVADGDRKVSKVTFSAVADDLSAVADGKCIETDQLADDDAFADDDAASAVFNAGDTASETDCEGTNTAVAAEQRLPLEPIHGTRQPRPSSHARNAEFEVGNFGLVFGNWGSRGTLENDVKQKERRHAHDLQVTRHPGQVLILAEATQDLEGLLQAPEQEGNLLADGLAQRNTKEHWVVRGNEEKGLLIAARKDNTTSLESLMYDVYNDRDYKTKGRPSQATSRIIVCRVGFKQNVGHLGKEIVFCGVHGHYRTMKKEWPTAWDAFWERLPAAIKLTGVQFMAGDFNMSLTEVPKQLRSHGNECDCVAWYPWQHDPDMEHHLPSLGFDSCGIIYIGGMDKVDVQRSMNDMDRLTAVAGDDVSLDRWPANNAPVQPWRCHRSIRHKEKQSDKHLRQRLVDLLTQTTTPDTFAKIPKRDGQHYCPYLRLKQKPLSAKEWLPASGVMHNGAHFPLAVFTNNARARSEEGVQKRVMKKKAKVRVRVGAKGRARRLLLLRLLPIHPQSRSKRRIIIHPQSRIGIATLHGSQTVGHSHGLGQISLGKSISTKIPKTGIERIPMASGANESGKVSDDRSRG